MLDLSFPKSVNPCYTYDTEETQRAMKYQPGGVPLPLRTSINPGSFYIHPPVKRPVSSGAFQ